MLVQQSMILPESPGLSAGCGPGGRVNMADNKCTRNKRCLIMKKTVFLSTVLLWLGVLATGTALGGDNRPDRERFQLFNAEYNSATIQRSQTTVFMEKRLFKIDTQTGETWMLIDMMRDGRDLKYWKKVKNAPTN